MAGEQQFNSTQMSVVGFHSSDIKKNKLVSGDYQSCSMVDDEKRENDQSHDSS